MESFTAEIFMTRCKLLSRFSAVIQVNKFYMINHQPVGTSNITEFIMIIRTLYLLSSALEVSGLEITPSLAGETALPMIFPATEMIISLGQR